MARSGAWTSPFSSRVKTFSRCSLYGSGSEPGRSQLPQLGCTSYAGFFGGSCSISGCPCHWELPSFFYGSLSLSVLTCCASGGALNPHILDGFFHETHGLLHQLVGMGWGFFHFVVIIEGFQLMLSSMLPWVKVIPLLLPSESSFYPMLMDQCCFAELLEAMSSLAHALRLSSCWALVEVSPQHLASVWLLP